ncbi:MAG: MATE family efflux transporter [Clostridia bacterium]|nr:MATE family efflux transporter [Clostridia bacterium]
MAKLSILKRPQVDMINGPLLKNMIKFAIPFFISNVLQSFFNAADLAVVGSFCGSDKVAAVGATGTLARLIVCLFVGLGSGAGVVVAHAIGAQNRSSIGKTVHTSIFFAFAGGAFLSVFGYFTCGYFLRLMNTPTEIVELSTLYLKIYFLGTIPMLLYNFGAAIIRATGDSRTPLKYLLVAGIINVVLNIIFVTVFDMSVDGVALATALSQVYSAVMVTRALMRREDDCKLDLRKLRIYKKEFIDILRIGIPSGIQSAMFSIANLSVQTSVNSFNSTAISSGHATSNSIESFVFMGGMALQQTAVNFMGQNVGAKNRHRVHKITATGIVCVTILYLIAAVIFLLWGEQLLGIYIKDSPEAIRWGMLKLTMIGTTSFIYGITDVYSGVLRGMGKAATSMTISVIGICGVRVLWLNTVFKIPKYHVMESVYMVFIISWIVTLLMQLVVYRVVTRKMFKKWQDEQKTVPTPA